MAGFILFSSFFVEKENGRRDIAENRHLKMFLVIRRALWNRF